ncbi:hypothetical protein RSAG8_05755, partial [Rhizoctonia solani AG-8 WAC10335]
MPWLSKTVVTLQLLVLVFSNLVHADDLDTIYTRQTELILSTTPVSSGKITNYIKTLKSDGSWSAIDYSSGCTARRSSWPAGGHWTRLLEMAAAYRGGGLSRYKHNTDLRSAIQKAMGYWQPLPLRDAWAVGAKLVQQSLVHSTDRVDGIKPDGSFQQHGGVIYDGNYGKDFANSFMQLELQALGTQFQADKNVQDSFARYFDGAKWMTYTNVMTSVVHWDLTVIGRFISYPVADGRASANLRIDLSQVLKLGNAWSQKDLIAFGTQLTGTGDNSANSGGLLGTRMFWSSDYLVHRTPETVSTVKMLSTRTTTSECINSENPFGFHLSDGLLYTYSTGAEYEDMFAALDYSIPPGITTDYAATKLECKATTRAGVEMQAGKSFGFYKAWFFFPDNVQHVLVSNIQQSTKSTAPVFSVLDQRLRSGDVYLNGEPISGSGNFTEANSLWHGGTGYFFPPDQLTRVSVSLQTRTGDWSKIGTSKEPLSVKDMFTAWLVHSRSDGRPYPHHSFDSNAFPPVEYSAFPATRSNYEFEKKAKGLRPRTVINSELVSAAMDSHAKILGAAFWKSSGGSISVREMGIRLEVDRGVVLMLKFEDDARTKGSIYVADPTHGTGSVLVKITRLHGAMYQRHTGDECSGHECSVQRVVESGMADVTLSLDLPRGGMAGSTVVKGF